MALPTLDDGRLHRLGGRDGAQAPAHTETSLSPPLYPSLPLATLRYPSLPLAIPRYPSLTLFYPSLPHLYPLSTPPYPLPTPSLPLPTPSLPRSTPLYPLPTPPPPSLPPPPPPFLPPSVDEIELEDAKWFEKEYVKKMLLEEPADASVEGDATFHVPSKVSLARMIIEQWVGVDEP